jgi:LPPG:FO 2-phospho-L-lactate transferase
MNIVIFSGGVGGARFLYGLKDYKGIAQINCTVISNVGDDFFWNGLKICPDIDTVIYHLTDQSGKFGWGIKDDSFEVLSNIKFLGLDSWFKIGDKDLSTHLYRTKLLAEGKTLSDVTQSISDLYGCSFKIIPITNEECPTTIININDEQITFQEYFAKRQFQDQIKEIQYLNNSNALPSPGVIEAINSADLIIFPPSNPFLSVEPMLQIQFVKEAIVESIAKKIAISPIIQGQAIKGPLAKIISDFGMEPNILSIAKYYKEIIDTIFIDEADMSFSESITLLGIKSLPANIILTDKNLSSKHTSAILDQVI